MHAYKTLAFSLALIGSNLHAATLNEVTERALARSPDVQLRLHEYNASSNEQQAARGGLRPRLDLEGYAGRERYDPAPGSSNYFNHPGAALQLRQLLFDGGATRNDIKRLGFAKATRYYELLQTADDIAYESARAYLDVQRYRQQSELAKDNWAIHKELYDQISTRVQAGVGRRVDLEQAGGRLALAQSNWLTDTSNLHDVGARFERIVGEAPPVLAEAPDLTKQMPEDKQVLTEALRNNPGFMAAVSNLRSARAQTDVRRAANAPTVEFRASTGVERNRSGVDGNYQNGVAQIVMNYNLYRGGADSARIQQAKELYNAAIDGREKSCRDIRQTTTIAVNNVRKQREQLRYLNQHLISTEKARDAYRQQFDIGQRTLLDLLDTENELFQARRAYTNAQYDLKQAEYQVLAVTHRLLPGLGLAPASAATPDTDEGELQDTVAQCSPDMPPPVELDLAGAMASRPTLKPPVPAPQAPAAAAPTLPQQCEFAAHDWAAAWSARDLKKYLGYYSDNFQPLTRTDREDWRSFRAQRLEKENISVELKNLEIKQLSADSCEVNFKQRYRSSDFKDDITKRLVLKHETTGWKIIQEIAPKKSSAS
ncbi:TolC family outer membrane protein [Uliginosibacterium sp. 31-16]|uniref:TolC family outer membrane protein n=1 Tax=Uliginosibacterium sp. 31-16 TaxID=3068315 RepID=UPI0027402785|nr:TolC family outer membrane protein [Uliginosibacterium sp. 31-16]MDP5240150.1 TolC family outer membrane protein [Uliginosibacterium sp. 31-16]